MPRISLHCPSLLRATGAIAISAAVVLVPVRAVEGQVVAKPTIGAPVLPPSPVPPSPVPPPREPARTAGSQTVRGTLALDLRRFAFVEKLAAATRLTLAIGLPPRNPGQLKTLLADLNNPRSPRFRRFLSPAEFAEEYGATDHDYQAVIDFARSSGLTVTRTYGNRLVVEVSGTVDSIQRAFYVALGHYKRADGTIFYAPDRDPSLDLSTPILHVAGLNDFIRPHSPLRITPLDRGGIEVPKPGLPHSTLRALPLPPTGPIPSAAPGSAGAKPDLGTGPGGLFGGPDFRAAYAPGVAANGKGQCVGLLEFDGFFGNDVTLYENAFKLPNVPVQPVLLDGTSGQAGSNNTEVALDIDMAIAMAPGLGQVVVFEGSNTDSLLGAMASPPSGVPLCQQLSASWNFGTDGTSQALIDEMAAQGQSLFVSSGDGAAYQGDPGDDRDSANITIVGGTVLAMHGSGTSWQAESAWPSGGGGILSGEGIPDYQATLDMAANHGSTTSRDAPDVSMVASGVFIFANNGQQLSVSGTSISSPLWAAYMSLANQQAQTNKLGPVGFANPQLYAITKVAALYKADFHDIQSGNNSSTGNPQQFSAVAGYDLATGWGSPRAALINELSPAPAAHMPTFAAVQFDVVTGGDDLRGNSTATVQIKTPGGGTLLDATLKAQDAGSWDNNSFHSVSFSFKTPVPAADFAKVTITLASHNGFAQTDDNWNIQNLNVRLVNPTGAEQCLLQLGGNPLARLTGSGPSATFTPRSGCP